MPYRPSHAINIRVPFRQTYDAQVPVCQATPPEQASSSAKLVYIRTYKAPSVGPYPSILLPNCTHRHTRVFLPDQDIQVACALPARPAPIICKINLSERSCQINIRDPTTKLCVHTLPAGPVSVKHTEIYLRSRYSVNTHKLLSHAINALPLNQVISQAKKLDQHVL